MIKKTTLLSGAALVLFPAVAANAQTAAQPAPSSQQPQAQDQPVDPVTGLPIRREPPLERPR